MPFRVLSKHRWVNVASAVLLGYVVFAGLFLWWPMEKERRLWTARSRVARTDPRLKACAESLEVRRSDSLSDGLSNREEIQLLESCLTEVYQVSADSLWLHIYGR